MTRRNSVSSLSSSPREIVSELRSQNLLKDPVSEVCKFTDEEIKTISPCFPKGTIFRPYDSQIKSDSVSSTWVCFPALPFLLGFSYPFPDLTATFFSFTGISYIQAMPMVWRTLHTFERLIVEKGLDFSISALSNLFTLATHGSSRFLLKSKTSQSPPISKTTSNDQSWKNQFFFVRRDSIPRGEILPKRWVLKGRIRVISSIYSFL